MNLATLVFAVLCIAILPAAAQSKPPGPYRIQIRMSESGPSTPPKTSRFLLLVQADSKSGVNASYRVPYYTTTKGEAKELHTVALGSIVDCMARDAEGGVKLNAPLKAASSRNARPRQSRWVSRR